MTYSDCSSSSSRDSLINEQKQRRAATQPAEERVIPPPPSPLPHPLHPGTRREARKQIKAAVERRHPVFVGRLGNALIFRPVFSTPYVLRSPQRHQRLELASRCENFARQQRPVIPLLFKNKKKKKRRVWTSGNICLGRLFVLLSGTPVCWEGKHCDKKTISLQIES